VIASLLVHTAAHRLTSAPVLAAVLALAGCSTGAGSADTDAGSDAATGTGTDADVEGARDDGRPPDAIDAAVLDAPVSADAVDAPALLVPALYPADRDQSPVTPAVVASLRAIAARDPSLDEHEFAKVGDSQTVSAYYMHCFGSGPIDWDTRPAFMPAVTNFRAGAAGGTDPFQRASLAAVIGWSAWAPLSGSPPPLQQEYDALRPRFATVMFGSNDTEVGDPIWFGANMLDLVDWLTARGVVPVLSSVPPRSDSATGDAWVPRYSAVVRAIAQARQVPFVDIERELRPIPGFGLGGDGLHLNVYTTAPSPWGCTFTPPALRYGQNLRNVMVIEGLSRALGAVRDGAAPDATAPALRGTGTRDQPFVIEALPFSDVRDTSTGGHRTIDTYPGCMSTADESGPEFTYRFDVSAPTRVRAMVLNRGTVDNDVHLLDASDSGAGCLQRNDRTIVADLAPGTYYFSLDTYVSGGVTHAGEYIFVLMAE
jgi:hypothetical protein